MRLFFLLLASLVVFFAIACEHNCPELVTYREGLHALDSSMYQEHEKLMADAVAKGLRTAGDNAVLQLQITQAEAHYQSSKKGDGPTTQP